ncbi:TolC family protein [Runella slithyformis]|uniref:Outer membrane efflux protein n=1 Tax=Runella slithyformis (strain ATCC 29530 / DSM 19594 / LMG 11500 / NCIMB 11436 / LSU 4) TaxID=761193 RepID=A0A7U4E799_RUNSL|nr:TolC family protein [Runella slithyformis]AEI50433.1 outer membrane efflux protein [Runella slithyformis DSM 19594]
MKRTVFLLIVFHTTLWAQTDTAKVFSYRDYYDLVLKNHPILRQSNSLSDQAKGELLIAKGGFDPKLDVNFDRKYFENKTYFNFWDNQLKVPLYWGGIDLKAGFERNIGNVLGTDIRTPVDGLSYVGLNVPVLQRFVIDERRATLQNARIFQNIAEAERIKMINKLALTAAKEYWEWYFAYRNQLLIKEFYELADQRFQLVSKRVRQGDLPAIDTADAQVTLLDRRVMFEQAAVELQNARLRLSNHLWDANGLPLELPETAVPQLSAGQVIDAAALANLLEAARLRHPEIRKLDLKAEQLNVDERLGREMLKPRFDIGLSSLNYMHRHLTRLKVPDTGTFPAFYKLNVDFSLPLLFRKERGKLEVIRVKQFQNNLDLQQLRREINNDVQAAYNDVKNLEGQIIQQQLAIQRQAQVLRAEEQRFSIGESQLFLVNQREAKLNELKVKLESMKTKYEKAKATLLFAAGTFE